MNDKCPKCGGLDWAAAWRESCPVWICDWCNSQFTPSDLRAAVVERDQLKARVADLETALRQTVCPHKNTGGGNDYVACRDCGLEWDYRKRECPTAEEIARKALQQPNEIYNSP